jgi:hypothetical protein
VGVVSHGNRFDDGKPQTEPFRRWFGAILAKGLKQPLKFPRINCRATAAYKKETALGTDTRGDLDAPSIHVEFQGVVQEKDNESLQGMSVARNVGITEVPPNGEVESIAIGLPGGQSVVSHLSQIEDVGPINPALAMGGNERIGVCRRLELSWTSPLKRRMGGTTSGRLERVRGAGADVLHRGCLGPS